VSFLLYQKNADKEMASAAIDKLRGLIEDYKNEHINATSPDKAHGKADQDIGRALKPYLHFLDELYDRIKSSIESIVESPTTSGNAETDRFTAYLISNGGLDYLVEYPESSDDFMQCIKSDIKVYQFTLNPGQIDRLTNKHVNITPLTDATIVSNEVERDAHSPTP